MYVYHGSSIQKARVKSGTDHCGSEGTVYRLQDLLSSAVIIDPRNGSKPLTAGRNSRPPAPVLIYAVDRNLELHVAFDGIRGNADAVKHETLFHNADVEAAGEMQVRRGIIFAVNDLSGSYRTAGRLGEDRRFARAVLAAIDRIAAPLAWSERRRLSAMAGIP